MEYGDLARAANARMAEGIVAYMTRAVGLALEILTGVENDPALDDVGVVRVAHNIGLCLADLSQHAAAVPYLYRSVVQFDARGMTTDQHEEVPSICSELVEQFTRAGLASQAILALAYLREAGALKANARRSWSARQGRR